MPLGETGYTSKGVTIERFNFEPLPTNDYKTRLVTEFLEVAKSTKQVGSIPYVNGLRLEALDTAGESGGKNRTVFTNLFTVLTVRKNARKCALEMPNGAVMLARALGEELDIPSDVIKTVPEYDNGRPTGDTVQYVDPNFLIAWLKAHDGMTVNAHIRRKKVADRPDRNEVAYYIPAESIVGNEVTTLETWGSKTTSNGVNTRTQ